MNSRRLFRRNDGTLRAPWRLAVFAVSSFLALVVVEILLSPLLVRAFAVAGARNVTTESWVLAIALIASTAVSLRYVDKRPWRDVWLGRDASDPARISAGFALGALAIGLPTALLIAAGWLRNDGGTSGSWWAAMVRVSLTLLPAALLEELMTRGYVLSVLRETWGWTWSIVVTSVAFGLLHLANPGVTPASVALVTLAGFFLAAVLYATKSLYAAWAAHFAWNWTMAVVFHTAVSGIPVERPRYGYVDAGPDWATGGEWGPEGGVPAALGMAAGTAALLRRRRATRPAGESDIHATEES